MSADAVDVGTAANDGTGDTLRAGMQEVNKFLQKADATTAAKVHVLEDTDGGAHKVIITISGTGLLAADRTLSLPTGGNLSLETIRTFAHTEAASGVPASVDFLEDSDNGVHKVTITAPSSAAADRTLTLISGGDLDLETIRKLAVTPAASGTAGSLALAEDTDNGSNIVTITAPAAVTSDRAVTLPDADLDLGALIAENTDGQMWIPAIDGRNGNGVWATATGSNSNIAKSLTPAAGTGFWISSINLGTRSSSSKGRKVTSYKSVYSCATGVADDITSVLFKQTVPADGTGMPSMVTLAGQVDGEYDTDHNTAAKRGDITGAPEYHTATVTVGVPAYVGADEGLIHYFYVDGDAGATSAVTYYGTMLYFSETLNDAS